MSRLPLFFPFSLCLSLCLCLCVSVSLPPPVLCMDVDAYVCSCVHAESWGWCWKEISTCLPSYSVQQVSQWTPELARLCLPASFLWGSTVSTSWGWNLRQAPCPPGTYKSSRRLMSALHHKTEALSQFPSLSRWSLFLVTIWKEGGHWFWRVWPHCSHLLYTFKK